MKNKKIILSAVLLVAALLVTAICIYAASTVSLSVNYTADGSVSVYVNGVNKGEAPFSAHVPKNAEIKLVNNASEGFMFFTDEYGNTLSENNEHSFVASAGASITAWYENTSSTKVQIIYRNTNSSKQILSTSTYRVSMLDAAYTEHLIADATKFGYEFDSWDKTVAEVISAAKGGAKTVIVSPKYGAAQTVFSVSVVGGKITSENLNNGQFVVNSKIELSANAPESGKKFAYWTNSKGVVVFNEATFTTVVAGNEVYTAHYVNEEEDVNLKPDIGLSAYYDANADVVVTNSLRFVPSEYTLVSYGLIYAKEAVKTDNEMTLDTVDGQTVKVAQYTNPSSSSGMSVLKVTCENSVSLRSFIIYKDAQGTQHTEYSECVNIQKTYAVENPVFNITFDSDVMPNGAELIDGASASAGLLTLSDGRFDLSFNATIYSEIKISLDGFKIGALPSGEKAVISVNSYVKQSESGDGLKVDWNDMALSAPYKAKDIVVIDSEGYVCLYDRANDTLIKTEKTVKAGTAYKLDVLYNINSKNVALYLNDALIATAICDLSQSDLESVTVNIKGVDADTTVDTVKVSNVIYSGDCNHSYQSNVVFPTCGDDGYTRHTCSKCGDYYDDSIVSATGNHTYGNAEMNAESTAWIYTCKDCNHTKTEYLYAVVYDSDLVSLSQAQEFADELALTFGYEFKLVEKGANTGNKVINLYSIGVDSNKYGWNVSAEKIDIYMGLYADFQTVTQAFITYASGLDSLNDATSKIFDVTALKTQNSLSSYGYTDNVAVLADYKYATMKNSVLSTANTDISNITGTVYYVSESGNDSNDGKSPSTAWKTLANVTASNVLYGDAVLFERGGVYRGYIIAASGVTYGCYGDVTKNKPIINGSDRNYAGLWTRVEGNIWKLDMPQGTIVDPGMVIFGAHTYSVDYVEENVGNRVFDRHTVDGVQNKVGDGYSQLTKNFNFYSGTPSLTWGTYSDKSATYDLYVYYDGDLNADFDSIEIAVDRHIMLANSQDRVTVDGLCFKYAGGHGIRGGHTGGTNNLTVKNCVFGWIGGSFLQTGSTTRYGNAIEIFGTATGLKVYNNWIYQIYDTGITFQYSGSTVSGNINIQNVDIYENIVEKCYWGFEGWIYPNGGVTNLSNVKIRNNLFREIQNTWGIDMHISSGISYPSNGGVFVLGGYSGTSAQGAISIYGNTVDRTFVKGHTGYESHEEYGQSRGYVTRVFKTETSVEHFYNIYDNDFILYDDQSMGRYKLDASEPNYDSYNGQAKYDHNFFFDAGNDEAFEFFGFMPYASNNKLAIVERPADLNQ